MLFRSFRDIKHGALTLSEGKEYILEGNTIVLTKRYLESMDVGVKLLNINFTSGQSIPFTINVINSMEDEGKFSINIASIEAKAVDIITIPVYVRGTPKQGVEAFASIEAMLIENFPSSSILLITLIVKEMCIRDRYYLL